MFKFLKRIRNELEVKKELERNKNLLQQYIKQVEDQKKLLSLMISSYLLNFKKDFKEQDLQKMIKKYIG